MNLKEQLVEGTFERLPDELIGGTIDTSCFDQNYKNDATGTAAVPPAALLKLVLYGYSKGANRSRKLQDLNRNNIIARAPTNDLDMHWTTSADFISGNGEAFKEVFVQVPAYCNEPGLIGNEPFAIDGCRLSSNAAPDMTGTKEELENGLNVYKRMAEKHVMRQRRIEKLSGFIETMEAQEGKRGQEIRSTVTDNESALILSPQGSIQGYRGTAVADRRNQIIVSAPAEGSADECEHVPEMPVRTEGNLTAVGVGNGTGQSGDEPAPRRMRADRNYWGEENFRAADAQGMEMIAPDSRYRQRLGENQEKRYEAVDFIYPAEEHYYECPCGKKLAYKGTHKTHSGETEPYRASVADCRACAFFRKGVRTQKEQGGITKGKALLIRAGGREGRYGVRMRGKLDTVEYQDLYTRRIQILEPVFSDIPYGKGLDRFTLRGREQVNGQWLLYCMVHHAGKCLKELNRRAHSA